MTGRVALAATAVVAAGLGYARRRVAAPITGDPPPDPAPVATLAGWRPAAPVSPLTRVLAYVWASPISLAGLVAAAGAVSRPKPHSGTLLFAGARGITGTILRLRGFTAVTLGHVVISRGTPSERLLAHELVHVRQAERLGVFIAPLYLGLLAVYGYQRHPMERAARLTGGEQPTSA